jgi:hypothetical protein
MLTARWQGQHARRPQLETSHTPSLAVLTFKLIGSRYKAAQKESFSTNDTARAGPETAAQRVLFIGNIPWYVDPHKDLLLDNVRTG